MARRYCQNALERKGVCGYGLDSTTYGRLSCGGVSKHGNEPMDYMKEEDYLDQVHLVRESQNIHLLSQRLSEVFFSFC
jgi:hypothetical protein